MRAIKCIKISRPSETDEICVDGVPYKQALPVNIQGGEQLVWVGEGVVSFEIKFKESNATEANDYERSPFAGSVFKMGQLTGPAFANTHNEPQRYKYSILAGTEYDPVVIVDPPPGSGGKQTTSAPSTKTP